jgi:hypothetical protein
LNLPKVARCCWLKIVSFLFALYMPHVLSLSAAYRRKLLHSFILIALLT